VTDDGEQVLAWYAKGQERGRRAAVGQERRRVLRVGPDGINDIRGFEDRHAAAHQLGT